MTELQDPTSPADAGGDVEEFARGSDSRRSSTPSIEDTNARSRSTLWSWTVFAVAVVWAGAPAFASYAAAREWWIAPLAYLLYQPICHQMPDRSFELWGHPMATCHRCTGLYLGFVLGLMVVPAWPKLRTFIDAKPWRLVLFAVPLLIDVSLYADNTASSRFTTGILAAVPLAYLAQLAARQLRRSWRVSGSASVSRADRRKPGGSELSTP